MPTRPRDIALVVPRIREISTERMTAVKFGWAMTTFSRGLLTYVHDRLSGETSDFNCFNCSFLWCTLPTVGAKNIMHEHSGDDG